MKAPSIYIFLFVWSCLYIHVPLRAGESFTFTRIGLSQGMPSRVSYIFEESNGLLWLGTPAGLFRYDGIRLKRYNIFIDNPRQPSSASVLQLVEDDRHRLWLLTDKGLARYSVKEDCFVPYLKEGGLIRAGAACRTTGGLVFGGMDSLYLYSSESERITETLVLDTENFDCRRMVLWNADTLVCSNRQDQLLFYDLKKRKKLPMSFSRWSKVAGMCVDTEGCLWVADYNDGLKRIAPDGRLLSHYTTRNSKLSNNLVLCVTLIDGKVWAGTDGGGINIIEPASGNIRVIEHEPDNQRSLPVNTIISIEGSRNGNGVWASTARWGVLNIRSVSMQTFQSVPLGYHRGLSDKTVLSLYQEPDSSSVWIGTDGGGLNRLDTDEHTFRHYPDTWGDKVVSVCRYSGRQLLLSVFGKGFFLFDKQTGRKEPFPFSFERLNNFVRYSGIPANLCRETDDAVLLLANPVCRYYIHEKRLEEIGQAEHGVIGMLCFIGRDGDSSYFYDTQSIYRLEKGGRKLITVYHSEVSNFINAVYRDAQGAFWIAGNSGLYVLEHGKLSVIPSSLFKEVHSVLCDRNGRVWIGTRENLLSYYPEEKRFSLFGEADGALKNDYLSKPVLQAGNGDIYMGGVNGLLYIAGETNNDVPGTSQDLRVIVTDLQVGESNCMSRLEQEKIVLPWDSRNIRIDFLVVGDDLLRPRLFRYSLEKGSRNAIVNYNAELNIPSLAVGTYPVYVEYIRKDGGWSAPQRVLTLIVQPPWYKSWWLAAILAVSVGFLLYLFARKFMRRNGRLHGAKRNAEQPEGEVHLPVSIGHDSPSPYALLKRAAGIPYPSEGQCRPLMNPVVQPLLRKDFTNMLQDAGRVEVETGRVDLTVRPLNAWVTEVCNDLVALGGDAAFMECKLDPQVEDVAFDPVKCRIVLTCLLANILEYSPKEGKVEVRTGLVANGQYVRISVAGCGSGLSDVESDGLLAGFCPSEAEADADKSGLSYAKQLVELQNGRTGVADIPGRGIASYFELPLRLQQNAERRPSSPDETYPSFSGQGVDMPDGVGLNPIDLKQYSVLIVDDNVELVDYVAGELRTRFGQVLTANDGLTAYQMACEENPDIIVCDVTMPNMNGYELCRAIKEDVNVSHIPVILLTARNDTAGKDYGYMLGADGNLEKPIEMERLVETVCNRLYVRLQAQKHYRLSGMTEELIETELANANRLFMKKLHQVVSDNLENPQLGIAFLCNQLGTSRASLYRKLKTITGMGANDYINQVRIERAMKLIKETELNFTEISERVGFASPRYFSTSFKQYTGKTPTQFKKE